MWRGRRRLSDGGAAEGAAEGTVELRLELSTLDGIRHTVDVGEIRVGRRTYPAKVEGCEIGCRLVALQLVAPALVDAGRPATVDIYRITQGSTDVASAEVLGDVTRWRPPVGASGVGTVMAATDGRLRISLYTGVLAPGQRSDQRVFVADAPTALPVLLAGVRAQPPRAGDARVNALGSDRVGFQVVGTAAMLPRVGDKGVLADLEYAQRDVDQTSEAAVLEVWLSADAPAEVVERLKTYGIEVLGEETQSAGRITSRAAGLASRSGSNCSPD